MGAARLLASQRRTHDRLRPLEHVVELERADELGVEGVAAVVQPGPREAPAELGELLCQLPQSLAGSEDAGAAVHAALEVLSDLADPLFATPEKAASLSFLRERVEQVLDQLDPREREVLRRRFGVGGGDPQTLEMIAIDYGISRERVRQIERSGLSRLRVTTKARRLEGFLGMTS